MEKNIILFNYYVQKLANLEKELLNLEDQKSSLLSTIVSHPFLVRRLATGCSMQSLWFCRPFYVEELFVYLCTRYTEIGMKLLGEFKFKFGPSLDVNKRGASAFYDHQIEMHLQKLFPLAQNKAEVDMSVYGKIIQAKDVEDVLKKFLNLSNVCNVNIDVFQLPEEKSKQMDWVDVLLEQAVNDATFVNRFIKVKYNNIGLSYAYIDYMDKW
jgi:hypothetical protein